MLVLNQIDWQGTIDPPHLYTISVEPAVEAGRTLEDREGQVGLQVLQTHGAGLWQACVTRRRLFGAVLLTVGPGKPTQIAFIWGALINMQRC